MQLQFVLQMPDSIRDAKPPEDPDTCTMCGSYCAVKLVNEWLDEQARCI